MIFIYEKILSSLFEIFEVFILIIFVLAFLNTLIVKIIEFFIIKKTKFIQDFNYFMESKEIDLKNKNLSKEDYRKSLYQIHEKFNYSPFYKLIEIIPFLVQLPFLISVYYSILNFEKLKGLDFLFIQDLSSPDHIFYGINLLPIIMFLINIIILRFEKNKINLKDLFFPFLFLILLYDMPSALIIYWTLSLLLTSIFPKIRFKKRIYSFYVLILTPFFLLKLNSINNIFFVLFFLFLALLFDNILGKNFKKLKLILIPLIFSVFYIIYFHDILILIFNEFDVEFINQPLPSLWRVHYSLISILILSLLISLLPNKTIKLFISFWIVILLFSNGNNTVGVNMKPSNAEHNISKIKRNKNSLVFIILDEYSPPSELVKFLNKEDQYKFYNYLQKNGWIIKDKLKTNELATSLSIYSMFNYNSPEKKLSKIGDDNHLFNISLNNDAYMNSLLLNDLRNENIKMESYGIFDFNKSREDHFLTQLKLKEADVFNHISSFSSILSFLDNKRFFFEIFSKTIFQRINDRFLIDKYNPSVFEFFTNEIISKYDFVYFHFDMPHGPFRYKNEFIENGNTTKDYAKFWNFTNLKFINLLKKLDLKNDKIIIMGDHGYRSNIEIDPYLTFGAFYGFDEEDLNKIKEVQDVGLVIKEYLKK